MKLGENRRRKDKIWKKGLIIEKKILKKLKEKKRLRNYAIYKL